jgi:hypothetical protein
VTWRSLPGEPNREAEASFFVFSLAAGQAEEALQDVAETSLLAIRAELPASVEKSGAATHRTNVVLKSAAADCR